MYDMPYEIEFIGVGNKSKTDADAICFRWKEKYNDYHIGVYDGGLSEYGSVMANHLNRYYFGEKARKEKIIDFVIVSHSDQDHTVGLEDILKNFNVQKLYMNRPWLYVDDVFDKVSDGRITKESLERRLKDKYKYIQNLENVAKEYKIPIYDAFQGDKIDKNERLQILSPSKEFYLQLLIESDKTPLIESKSQLKGVSESLLQKIGNLKESWCNELLKEDVDTSAENEMSVILHMNLDEKLLLTGDAGKRALTEAMNYYEKIEENFLRENINVIQVPHHGGRHNVTPKILNRLLGEKLEKGYCRRNIRAFVSTAEESDHPKQMVVNAFLRRGVEIFATKGCTVRHNYGMDSRDGWSAVEPEQFSENVEDWRK